MRLSALLKFRTVSLRHFQSVLGQLVITAGCLGLGLWQGAAIQAAPVAADYRLQGLTYRQQGNVEAAIAAFRSAVALDPANLDGGVLLGWTLHLAGDRAQATARLQETLNRNPFYVPTLNALGIVYLVEGQLYSAVLTHSWAALLKPDNEIAYYNLSLAFERLEQYGWAIATAEKAAILEPYNPHPLIALAMAHWQQGDSPMALTVYADAIALDPRYANVDFLLYLDEAGFSSEQIELSQTILRSL